MTRHNVFKRTLAGILAVLTVAVYMPANAGGLLTGGMGIVAKADTLAEDWAEVTPNQIKNIKLTAGYDSYHGLDLTGEFTLDLNGYKILGFSGSIAITETSDITIIDSSAEKTGRIGGGGGVYNAGNLTVIGASCESKFQNYGTVSLTDANIKNYYNYSTATATINSSPARI